MPPPLPTPSAEGVHLLLADCCLHANWATLRKTTRTGPFCTKNRGVAGPLLALPLPLYVTWGKSFLLFASQIRRNRLMLACSGVGNLAQFKLDSMCSKWEAAKLQARDPPPKVPTKCRTREVCTVSQAAASVSPAPCPRCQFACGGAQEGCRALVVSSPWDNPERKLSASSPMHRWQVQPSLLSLDFQAGLKEREPKDNINPSLLRLPLEIPGKSAEDI